MADLAEKYGDYPKQIRLTFSPNCSRRWLSVRTSIARSSLATSSRCTERARAQKGDSKPDDRDIVRRHHNLDTGAHRCHWKSCISIAPTIRWLKLTSTDPRFLSQADALEEAPLFVCEMIGSMFYRLKYAYEPRRFDLRKTLISILPLLHH